MELIEMPKLQSRLPVCYPRFKLGTARLLYDGTNLSEGAEVKGEQDRGISKPVKSHSASRKLNGLPIIPAVRAHGLVRSAHTRKSSSAHVPSHCNRPLSPEYKSRALAVDQPLQPRN
jgi:hypothetical protein